MSLQPSASEATIRSRIGTSCADALRNSLTSLTGTDFQVKLHHGVDPEKPKDPIIWRQAFSVAEGALAWLATGRDLWETAGRMILGGAGADPVSDEDCRSTWQEIAVQTMSGIAQAASSQLGREILAERGEQDSAGPGDQNFNVCLEICDGTQTWHVHVAWSGALEDAFAVPAQQSEKLPAGTQETAASKTLDLLLDVALPVSVSFGKTTLHIREVLKLNTGSVVELDRLVSEPVEVIVNDCVIARGEVVVVDGNYGVRVLHLATRAERLRSGMSEAASRLGIGAK